MNRIMECVPNFSEGRDLQKIDKIVAPFRARAGVKLLDYSNDEDHNRLVVTVVGEPEPLRDAVLEAIGVAVELIDLNHHQGQHPRMGAVDVVPFIPIRGVTMDDAIALSREVGEEAARRYGLPVFLYENRPRLPTGKTWLPSVRVNSKAWPRRYTSPSGSPTSALPNAIRRPAPWPSEPACRWWPTTSTSRRPAWR